LNNDLKLPSEYYYSLEKDKEDGVISLYVRPKADGFVLYRNVANVSTEELNVAAKILREDLRLKMRESMLESGPVALITLAGRGY